MTINTERLQRSIRRAWAEAEGFNVEDLESSDYREQADAILPLVQQHVAFEVARELGRQVPELPDLRAKVALLDLPAVDVAAADDPMPLRWGLDDVLHGDDDTVTVLLSGPTGEPYWLELEPDRATALRAALVPLPSDDERHVVARELEDALREAAFTCESAHDATEAQCFDAHPVRAAGEQGDVVVSVYGSVTGIVDAILPAVTAAVRRALEAAREEQVEVAE